MSDPRGGQARLRRPRAAAALLDVFAYVVVLNLFVQLVPQVLSESFTLTLLTALLLKLVLELVLAVKHRAVANLHRASGPPARVSALLVLWAVLFGSKLVVLEAVALVFGDAVSLGGFVPVTLLVLSLMLARGAVRRVVG